MFGSWIVVAKTVKNFYKLGYTISIKISVKTGNGFFLETISGQLNQQISS